MHVMRKQGRDHDAACQLHRLAVVRKTSLGVNGQALYMLCGCIHGLWCLESRSGATQEANVSPCDCGLE